VWGRWFEVNDLNHLALDAPHGIQTVSKDVKEEYMEYITSNCDLSALSTTSKKWDIQKEDSHKWAN
jgi:hypothetical protein